MKLIKIKHRFGCKLLLPRPWLTLALGSALLLDLGGCASMHDGAQPLAPIDANQIRLADTIKLARDGWPEAQWWHRYNDSQLNTLIEQALKDAPVMAVAKSRITASAAQASLANSARGLQVNFNASIDRQDLSYNGFGGPFTPYIPSEGLTGPWYTEGTLGFDAGYAIDLWGKDRSRVEAAIGARNARQAEAANTELVLSSRVAHVYFNIQTLYADLSLLEQARDLVMEVTAAHAARAAHGLEPQTPTELARAHKLELDKQISAAHAQISVLTETLRALIGAGPDNLPAIKPLPLPDEDAALPATLGYELLARRPDLQAMRWYVIASQHQIDVAKDAFYPSFDIKAFYGLDSLHLANLFHESSRQINLIPGMSLPILNNGRLNASLSEARAQNNVMIAQYNQSILDAVREVAQVGFELESLNQQAQLQQAKLASTQFAADSAAAQYKTGMADKVPAMEEKLAVLSEQVKMNNLHSQQIDSEIVLTAALGGGYKSDTGVALTEAAKTDGIKTDGSSQGSK